MLKGPGENLRAEKQDKLFSPFSTFVEVLQNWHKIQLSLFSTDASILKWALVCFLFQQ
jgi:hypothetical protein